MYGRIVQLPGFRRVSCFVLLVSYMDGLRTGRYGAQHII
jgi:hypothetical protein